MSAALVSQDDWVMIPSGANHEQQHQQHQQQEKMASELFAQRALQERRLKPPDQVISCPRCQSLNTKFCYYNNYSLTQPRHFCKNCRRYWTAGGSLRNVPVGGGCRKNKRTKPRTPEESNSGVKSDSFAIPGLQHPGFPSMSVGFLNSSDGSAYGLENPPMRAAHPSMNGTGGLTMSLYPGSTHTMSMHPAAQSSRSSQHPHSHPFEGCISSLNNFLRSTGRPETTLNLHPTLQTQTTGDLSEIFDASKFSRSGALAALSQGLGAFNSNLELGRD